MKPQLHSPPMSPGRLTASCLAVLAAGAAILGCGSSGPVQVDIPAETVTAINGKLDQIQQRFADGDCSGRNSAESSLESLRAAVGSLEVDQQFIDDVNEMLDNLDKQIADQCQAPDETTTTSTDTLPTATTPTATDTLPTATETTTKETTETTTTTTQTTTTAPTGPPTTPGGGNPGGGNPGGGGPGGGVSPGAGKRERASKRDGGGKRKPGGGVKASTDARNGKDSRR